MTVVDVVRQYFVPAFVFFLLIATVAATDGFEPDDTSAQASILARAGTQSHTFHDLGDEDWMRLQVFAGELYTVRTFDLQGPADPFLNVTNATGAPIANNDSGGAEPFAAALTFTATQTGTYFIQVRDQPGFPFGPGGAYTVNVTPHNGTLIPLNITAGVTLNKSGRLTGDLLNTTGGTQAPTNGINIGEDDLLLDCQGFTIRGAAIGINVTGHTNVTLRNCDLQGFQTDILYRSSSGLIDNATLETATVFQGSASFRNNTVQNLSAQDTQINTINQSVQGYFLLNSTACLTGQHGSLCLEQPITANGMSLGADLTMADRQAQIASNFDRRANITFHNTTPRIQSVEQDGAPCGANCSQYVQTDKTFFVQVAGSGTYTVTEDHLLRSITLTGAARTSTGTTSFSTNAFNIAQDGITLDCAGFMINGSNIATGINVTGVENVTVRDCVIEDFTTAIQAERAFQPRFTGNRITNALWGVRAFNATAGAYLSNNLTNATTGFMVVDSNSTIQDVQVTGGTTAMILRSTTSVSDSYIANYMDGVLLNASVTIVNTSFRNHADEATSLMAADVQLVDNQYENNTYHVRGTSDRIRIEGNHFTDSLWGVEFSGDNGQFLENRFFHDQTSTLDVDGANITIQDNNITNATTGLELLSVSSGQITGNRINATTAMNVFMSGNLSIRDNVFWAVDRAVDVVDADNISLQDNMLFAPAAVRSLDSQVTLQQNNAVNVTFTSGSTAVINQTVASYNISTDLQVTNPFGRIHFNVPITQVERNFSDDLQLIFNSAFVNSTNAPGLNRSANVTLFAVPNIFLPIVYRDGKKCSTQCTPLNLTGPDYSFLVSSFSNYTIGENGDAFEFDDNRGNASNITFGVRQRHTFVPANDIDIVRFTAVPGVHYLINTTNITGNNDTFLEVRDASGTLLASNDNGGGNLAAFINFTTATPRQVFVQVTEANNRAFGAYDLLIEQSGCASPSGLVANTDVTLCPFPRTQTITSSMVLNGSSVACSNLTLVGAADPAITIIGNDSLLANCKIVNASTGISVRSAFDVELDNISIINTTTALHSSGRAILHNANLSLAQQHLNISGVGNVSVLDVSFDSALRPVMNFNGFAFSIFHSINLSVFNRSTDTTVPFARVEAVDLFSDPRINTTTQADGRIRTDPLPLVTRVGVLEFNNSPYVVNVSADRFRTAGFLFDGTRSNIRVNLSDGGAPVLSQVTPETGTIVVPLRAGSQTFRFTAQDPEQDQLTATWRVNGSVIVNADPFSYTLAFSDVGDHNITATVSDGLHTETLRWKVQVRSGPTSTQFTGNFTGLNATEQETFRGLVIERPSVGRIEFLEAVNLTQVTDLDNRVIIDPTVISVNTTFYPQLDKRARITLYDLSHTSIPTVFFDTDFSDTTENVTCSALICSNITYVNNDLTLDVERFSTFYVIPPGAQPIPPPGPQPVPQSTELAIGNLDFGDDTTERLSTLTRPLTITNNGNNNLSNFGFVTSAPTYDVNVTGLPTLLNPGQTTQVDVSLTIPLAHDAVDDTCERVPMEVGTLQITAEGGTVGSNQAILEVQAESKLDVNDAEISGEFGDESVDDGDRVEVEPADNLRFAVEVENTFSDRDENDGLTDIDIDDVTMEVKSDDSDVDTDDDDDTGSLDAEDTETLEVDIEVEEDIEDGNYDLLTKICGEDENGARHGDQLELTLEIDKPSHEILVERASLSQQQLSCSDPASTLSVTLYNSGKSDEDAVFVQLRSDALLLQEKRTLLRELDETDRTSFELPFRLPDNAEEGSYELLAETGYAGKVTDSQRLELNVLPCKETRTSEVTTPTQATAQARLSLQPSARYVEPVRKASQRLTEDSIDWLWVTAGILVFLLILTLTFLLLL